MVASLRKQRKDEVSLPDHDHGSTAKSLIVQTISVSTCTKHIIPMADIIAEIFHSTLDFWVYIGP